MGLHVSQILPAGWRDLILPGYPVGIGVDLGTTQKAKSNPTALALVQRVMPASYCRVAVRWKTNNPDITRHVLASATMLPHGLRPVLCIDSSNERFFAADLKKTYAARCKVLLYVAGEAIEHKGERMPKKTYVGNLLKNELNDSRIALPADDWIYRDLRLVQDEAGGFAFNLDEDGNHADFAQALMLALFALDQGAGGPIQASAVNIARDTTSPNTGRDPRAQPSPRFS